MPRQHLLQLAVPVEVRMHILRAEARPRADATRWDGMVHQLGKGLHNKAAPAAKISMRVCKVVRRSHGQMPQDAPSLGCPLPACPLSVDRCLPQWWLGLTPLHVWTGPATSPGYPNRLLDLRRPRGSNNVDLSVRKEALVRSRANNVPVDRQVPGRRMQEVCKTDMLGISHCEPHLGRWPVRSFVLGLQGQARHAEATGFPSNLLAHIELLPHDVSFFTESAACPRAGGR